ncbi:MAG: DUF1559 domain-containing protein [Patescibacteria group bacterium]|nr:DUF1559 domain-containing protein [Patescibacteria group bacterium]
MDEGIRTRQRRRAVTLVELLVVVAVIGLLMAMLLPALNAAREAGRRSACMNNLRQIGVGMASHASRSGAFCTGAFHWSTDGAVTEHGWVADAVNSEIPVGKMLCASNTSQVAATYNELLDMDTTGLGSCVDYAGSAGQQAPDGTTTKNPCRSIIEGSLTSDQRRELIENEVLKKHYNTNYTASWFLVRGAVLVNDSGNLRARSTTCSLTGDNAKDIASQRATAGPLKQSWLDGGQSPSSLLPLLGDGRASAPLTADVASFRAGSMTVHPFTYGPVLKTTMAVPTFEAATPYTGANGWWKVWTRDTLQDYRAFSPVHAGLCNMLMADGSVQNYLDENRDGYLNNGFTLLGSSGFTSDEIELPADEVFSAWALRETPN